MYGLDDQVGGYRCEYVHADVKGCLVCTCTKVV